MKNSELLAIDAAVSFCIPHTPQKVCILRFKIHMYIQAKATHKFVPISNPFLTVLVAAMTKTKTYIFHWGLTLNYEYECSLLCVEYL